MREHSADLIQRSAEVPSWTACKAAVIGAAYEDDFREDYRPKTGVANFTASPRSARDRYAFWSRKRGGRRSGDPSDAQKVKSEQDYISRNVCIALMSFSYTLSVPWRQMIVGGFDILRYVAETCFRGPGVENTSDDIPEAPTRGIIRNFCAAARGPLDYEARGNLM